MNNQSDKTENESKTIDFSAKPETEEQKNSESVQGRETGKPAANESNDENSAANRQKKQLISVLAILLVFGGIGYFYWTTRAKPVEAAPEIKIPLLGKLVQTPQSYLMNAQKIDGGRYLVNSLEYDQGRLSIVSADGQITRQYKFESPIPFVRPLDKNKFAVGTVLGDLYFVDADQDTATKLLTFENGMISCLAQADGNNLIAGNLEGEIVYWNAAEQKITAAWKTPDGTTPRVCSTYGDKELLVVDAFSNIFAAPLFGKNSLKQIKSLTDDGSFENGKYSPVANLLAICQNSVLNIYHLPGFNGVMRLKLDPEYLDFLVSPNAKTVVVFTPVGFKAYDMNGKEIFSQPINRLASVSYLTDSAVLTVTEGGEPVEYSFVPQKAGQ
jgi:hypothetical protein